MGRRNGSLSYIYTLSVREWMSVQMTDCDPLPPFWLVTGTTLIPTTGVQYISTLMGRTSK